ncbi:MAG TPA: hypothetical protein VM733_10895 [Thermoanaerobaculia bacterium]|nr:hypothetical protein [Thermoanaerobaculia bacterium]
MKRVVPLVLAIAVFFILGIAWIITDRRAAERVFDDYSSQNTGTTGLSQAAAYLARRGRSAMLTRQVQHAGVEANAVVFRITHELPLYFDPEDLDEKKFGPPRPRENPLLSDAEDAFVRHGGRMVVGAHIGALEVVTPVEQTAKKVFPIWAGVDTLTIPEKSSAFRVLRPRMHALFIAGSDVIVARERIGDGDLFVIAWPEVFRNDLLSQSNHLALLAALAGKRPVYFDEVPHGIATGEGALELAKEWNLGPFLLMLVAVAALVFWRASRRVGPPEDEHRETRSDAVDLVRSLAALYQDVTSYAEAIALYHDSLTRTVAHTTGLRGDALRTRVEELTGGRRTMTAINEGFERLKSTSRRVSKSPRSSSATRRLEDSSTRRA